MTRFQTLLAAAAAAFYALPAFAHDGVHIENAYARSNGGIGATGAIFFEITNHADVDDRLIGVTTDIAAKAELHTHKETADGVMQMLAVPEGFPITALQGHALKRGGDHIMLMGLKQALKDGDIIHLTLTFEHAGKVPLDVPVDNARKDGASTGAAMTHDMSAMEMPAQDASDPHAGHDMSAMDGAMEMAPAAIDATDPHAAHKAADTTGMTDADAIIASLKAQFETPDSPLSVDPVVVQGDHALASWAQGDKGGRALLQRVDGQWRVILCGGADLRMPEFLTEHAVTAAESLSQMYNAAEDALGADKVALSSSFEGVVMVSH